MRISRIFSWCCLVALSLAMVGCSETKVAIAPTRDLKTVRTVYIVDQQNSTLPLLMLDDLDARGYKATVGPQTPIPPSTDLVLTFEERWAWDNTTYLAWLAIDFRDPATLERLARVESHRVSLERQDAPDVVKDTLDHILAR